MTVETSSLAGSWPPGTGAGPAADAAGGASVPHRAECPPGHGEGEAGS